MIKTKILSGATILILALAFSLPVQAQLSLADKMRLERYKEEKISSRSMESDYIPAFIGLKSAEDIRELEEQGVEFLNAIGDIYIVSLPIDSVERIADSNKVKRIELSSIARPMLNTARTIGDVNAVNNGTGLSSTHGFSGEGMFVALFDTGLDPNNPNFTDRVEVVYNYSGSPSGNIKPDEYTGNDIAKFTTDNSQMTHGTHVLGIMAGSQPTLNYYDYTIQNSGGGLSMTAQLKENATNPFIGVAPKASIGVSCAKSPYTTFILDAMDRLIKYAQNHDYFPVINLSMGTNSGPHDNSTYEAQVFSRLGKEANIIISSGNEADENIAISKTFTLGDKTLKTVVAATDGYYRQGSPYVEIWGKNADVLEVNLVFAQNGVIQDKYQLTQTTQYITLSDLYKQNFTSGRIGFAWSIDSSNNRFNAVISGSGINQVQNSQLQIGIEIIGSDGQRADAFCSNCEFTSNNWDGWTQPDGNMSINALACADNIIACGAMVSNPYFHPLYSTSLYGYDYKAEDVAPYSSFGTLINGKSLPQFVAPGSTINSSLSYYYTSQSGFKPEDDLTITGLYKSGNRNYYWGVEQGTSMAAPFASGVIALWQQAAIESNGKPLTLDQIIEVATKTAIKNAWYLKGNKKQWGAGTINAFEGIKQILSTTALGALRIDPQEDNKAFMLKLRGKEVNIFIAGASAMDFEIISLTGQRLLSRHVDSNDHTQMLDHLANGIYLLKIKTPEGGNYTRKINLH